MGPEHRLQGRQTEPLVEWILRRIAKGPASATEILAERGEGPRDAPEGRPSPILPVLRRLVDQGYATAAVEMAIQGEEARLRVTKKGMMLLDGMSPPARAPGGPTLFRRFPSLPDPPVLPREHDARSPRSQFEATRGILASKPLSPSERERFLREYASSLEGQLNWTTQLLGGRKSGPEASRRRIR